MIDKLHTIITRYDELADLMSQPGAMQDMKAFTKLAREHSGLTELVEHSKKRFQNSHSKAANKSKLRDT